MNSVIILRRRPQKTQLSRHQTIGLRSLPGILIVRERKLQCRYEDLEPTWSIAVYSPQRLFQALSGSSLPPSDRPQSSKPQAEAALEERLQGRQDRDRESHLHEPHTGASAAPPH